jgi:DNA-binding CsgD family transcriptional regulator
MNALHPTIVSPDQFNAPAAWQSLILEEIDYGIVMLTPQLQVTYCNGAARNDLTSPSPVVLTADELRARSPRDDTLLHDALRAATQRGLRRLLTFRRDESALTMAVVPMDRGGDAPQASVLVILGRRRMCETLSAQGLAKCLGLTPTEGRVLAHLSAQQRPADIAHALCVALSTVRTHIASIRAKTGVSSIRELIQLIARLPPLTNRLMQ